MRGIARQGTAWPGGATQGRASRAPEHSEALDEQARIVQLLVERVEIAEDKLDIRFRTDELAGLVREFGVPARAAASAGPLDALGPRALRRPEARRTQAGDHADGTTHRPRPHVDSALVKALARTHRWQRLLESGECASITVSPS